MAIHGAFVIYADTLPATPPKTAKDVTQIARKVLQAFEDAGFAVPGIAADVEPDDEPTFVTEDILEDPPRGTKYVHFCLLPEELTAALSALLPVEPPPVLDVTILTTPVTVRCPYRDIDQFQAWALIELSYEGARLTAKEHHIRDAEHPLLQKLATILKTPLNWDIVAG